MIRQKLVTLAQRPELEAQIPRLHAESWPAFIQADAIAIQYWGRLFATFAEYQSLLCDEQDHVLAASHSIPLYWNERIEDLPAGWDGALEQGFRDYEQGRAPSVLCGLSVVIAPAQQGQGLSELLVQAMKDSAALDDLNYVIIPVRPSLKSRYPLIPMEHYTRWQHVDGSPFDPWLRIHHRLGAQVLTLAPNSMVITGTRGQWEEWTGMRMPGTGSYIVSGALEPVHIDCERDHGRYEETNVWVSYLLR